MVDIQREVTRTSSDESSGGTGGKRRRTSSSATYSRMGPKNTQVKRDSPLQQIVPNQKQHASIRECLGTIFYGPIREKQYKEQVEKYNQRLLRETKHIFCLRTRTIMLTELSVVAIDIRIKFGASLNAPVPLHLRPVIHTIGDAIYGYLCRVWTILSSNGAGTFLTCGKSLATFTAFVAQTLATGYNIGGTVIIPIHPFVQKHVPNTLQ